MSRHYFTLAVRYDGRWCPEFGDYKRAVIVSERDDFREHKIKAKDLKIIKTGDRAADISAAIAKLNGVKTNG